MAVDAILGDDARLYYSADGVTYTELSNVVEIPAPDGTTAEQVEVLALYGNTAAEYLNGIKRNGKFTARIYWNKTVFNTLLGFVGVSKYWKVTYPDTSTFVAQGNVSKVSREGLSKGAPVVTLLEVQLSGDVTYTAAS